LAAVAGAFMHWAVFEKKFEFSLAVSPASFFLHR
jgi:hypothetical protein